MDYYVLSDRTDPTATATATATWKRSYRAKAGTQKV
jgi:alkaline phosphatase D